MEDNANFQELLRRFVEEDPQNRDQGAWTEFVVMFEAEIRLVIGISGGKVPQVQAIMETQDLINSVWCKALEGNWVKDHFAGKSRNDIRCMLIARSVNHLLQQIRKWMATKRGRRQTGSLDADIDVVDIREELPDVTVTDKDAYEFVMEKVDVWLRELRVEDEDRIEFIELIDGKTTFQILAAKRKKKLESVRRWFERRLAKLCERFGDLDE